LVPDRDIRQVAKAMVSSGLVYLCVWGPDCERVHDQFDHEIVRASGLPEDLTVMTSWHSDEALERALSFHLADACPDDDHWSSSSYIAVSVGDLRWSEEIARRYQDLGSFLNEMSPRE